MNKTMWVLNWEDTNVFTSDKEAIRYVEKKAKEYGIQINWLESNCNGLILFDCTWDNGDSDTCEIIEAPVVA